MHTQRLTLGAALCCAIAAPSSALAADIGLAEWLFNVDGNSYGNLFVTPDAITDVPGLDSSSFNVATGLGTLLFQTTAIGNHSFVAFFDHEINVPLNGFNNENGSTTGAAAAGQSWEMDEPFDGDIWFNAFDNTLDNANAVDTGSFPIGTDVSMATAFDFVLAADQIASIRIDIAESLSTTALKLIQTDFGTQDTVEMSAGLTIRNQGPTPTPVPATLALLGVGLFGLRWARRHP